VAFAVICGGEDTVVTQPSHSRRTVARENPEGTSQDRGMRYESTVYSSHVTLAADYINTDVFCIYCTLAFDTFNTILSYLVRSNIDIAHATLEMFPPAGRPD
jgi:hypothetical protein